MMQLNGDLFTRKLFSSIQMMIKKAISVSKIPTNQVGTVTAVSGTYPNQKASILLPGGTVPIPNIQNASIHVLAPGDQVYIQMIYGDLSCPVILIKKQ